MHGGLSSTERERLKALERENRELRVAFVDAHREEYGVEPLCAEAQIAPASYYEHKARERDPERLPLRVQRDRWLQTEVKRVWKLNYEVYGAEKVWRQLTREHILAARCTVERLMRGMGLRGVVRGATCKTTFPAATDDRPGDLVQRQFTASRPNQLWVADFTTEGLIHHSDRGSQYLSVRYSERLAEAGIGLFKTEVIRRRGPWRHGDAVEYATLEWVDWFNHRRLLEPIAHVPPAEFERAYHQQREEQAMAA